MYATYKRDSFGVEVEALSLFVVIASRHLYVERYCNRARPCGGLRRQFGGILEYLQNSLASGLLALDGVSVLLYSVWYT